MQMAEAARQRCSLEKVFWKNAANLQENTHAEVQSNFIEITLWNGCFPVNLLHIFRAPFLRTPFDDCFWNGKGNNASCKGKRKVTIVKEKLQWKTYSS